MRIIISLLLVGCLVITIPVTAQYAPQAGLPGSTAIAAESPLFMAWASGCIIHRGYVNIDSPSLLFAGFGDSTDALGAPDRSVVSLGDSGVAIVTFPAYVFNGDGPDFAVFENGFSNPGNDTMAYLELAFVAVSSDGENFFTFPCRTFVNNDRQIRGAGDYMRASEFNNLAGKYKGGYGTPFDLEELAGITGLDINRVTHIRLTDVVGSLTSAHASKDSIGHIINDPFPTPYPTGGFDLDAVGVIHYPWAAGITALVASSPFILYPIPVGNALSIKSLRENAPFTATLLATSGMVLQEISSPDPHCSISMDTLPEGLYYLVIIDKQGNRWMEKVIKG
jgi:hypothetical protein